jgi:hypothetical protein
LSAFPRAIREQVLEKHRDLYRRHDDGFPALHIVGGSIDISSVADAPFGVAEAPALDEFKSWSL